YACAADIVSGNAHLVVYVVLFLTLIFVAITGTSLYNHRSERSAAPNIASWVVWLLVIATVLAAVFGLFPLLLPQVFASVGGLKGTDVFIYRQAGAATLGYAIMGIFELRSRNWQELRFPALMAAVFNGLSFVASVAALLTGQISLLALLVAPVALAVTIALGVALRRGGR